MEIRSFLPLLTDVNWILRWKRSFWLNVAPSCCAASNWSQKAENSLRAIDRWPVRPTRIILKIEATLQVGALEAGDTDPFDGAEDDERIGEIERLSSHPFIDQVSEVLEIHRRWADDADVVLEGADGLGVDFVFEQTSQIFVRIVRVVAFHVDAQNEIFAFLTQKNNWINDGRVRPKMSFYLCRTDVGPPWPPADRCARNKVQGSHRLLNAISRPINKPMATLCIRFRCQATQVGAKETWNFLPIRPLLCAQLMKSRSSQLQVSRPEPILLSDDVLICQWNLLINNFSALYIFFLKKKTLPSCLSCHVIAPNRLQLEPFQQLFLSKKPPLQICLIWMNFDRIGAKIDWRRSCLGKSHLPHRKLKRRQSKLTPHVVSL